MSSIGSRASARLALAGSILPLLAGGVVLWSATGSATVTAAIGDNLAAASPALSRAWGQPVTASSDGHLHLVAAPEAAAGPGARPSRLPIAGDEGFWLGTSHDAQVGTAAASRPATIGARFTLGRDGGDGGVVKAETYEVIEVKPLTVTAAAELAGPDAAARGLAMVVCRHVGGSERPMPELRFLVAVEPARAAAPAAVGAL